MRRTPTLLAALVLAVGCAPQSASITRGTYTAMMSANTSPSLFQSLIDFDAADNSYSIDCDDFGLPSPRGICDDPLWEPEHETWLLRDGYRVVQEPLEPWRGEAVVTSEGDLQLTFHQRIPGGEDFRFAIVVDPHFQPTECVTQDNGSVRAQPLDGDWVAEWSADENGTMFYLNAGAYQFNPSNTEVYWILPQQWRAGYTTAKLSAEQFIGRRVRYGAPEVYTSFELEESGAVDTRALFYASSETAIPSMVSRVETIAQEVEDELALVGVDGDVKVHGNEWRPYDGRPEGLDGWTELHYNWIRFDRGSELEVGGAATGEFFLTFDGVESQSRVFVGGDFEVKRFHRDVWVTDDVNAIKLEESGTELCQ